MKKGAFISLAIAAALGTQSVYADIGTVICDYKTGECRVSGYLGNAGGKAAIEVLKPSKTVHDSDAYEYVSEASIGDDGKFNSVFKISGISGDYLIRVGAGKHVFEKRFTFISKSEYEAYVKQIESASSWDDIRIVFEKDYGRLKSMCRLSVNAEDKERVYRTIYEAVKEKDISEPEKLQKIIAEVVLIDRFMGEKSDPYSALEAIFDSFDSKYLPAAELWKNTSFSDNSVKDKVVNTLQKDIISSLAEFEEKFAESVIYENLKGVSSKGKEVQILALINPLIPFKQYDYFSLLSDAKKISILQNMNTSFGNREEYAKYFDEAAKASKHSQGDSKNNNKTDSSKTSYVQVDSSNTTQKPGGNNPKEESKAFSDIENYEWAKNAILRLYERDIIHGKSAGIFAPSDNVKREEFTSMIIKALGLYDENAECTQFEDVQKSDWYYKAVASAFEKEIVKGVSETSFGAGNLISRQDAAVLCKNAAAYAGAEFEEDDGNTNAGISYEYQNHGKNAFADADEIADYAKSRISALAGKGIISGMPDGNFKPKDNMTRAQAAVIIERIMNLVEETKATSDNQTMSMLDMMKKLSVYNGESTGLASTLTRKEASKIIAEAMNLNIHSDEKSIFDDCTDEYAPYIRAVAEKKLLNGENGKFCPDDELDFDTAVSIMVKALGYNVVAENDGGFPKGYEKIAYEKGILKNISRNGEESVTKLEFLKMIYNSLDADVMETKYDGTGMSYDDAEEMSFLNHYKKIYKKKGQVCANHDASIGGKSRTVEGEINISGQIMINKNDDFDKLIGREVTYYFKKTDNDDEELVYAKEGKKTKVLTLGTSDIISLDGLKYTYLTDEMSREKTIEIKNSVNVIYNNRTIYDFSEGQLLPKEGTVQFIDYDGDGIYGKDDLVIVNAYKNIVVAGCDIQNKIIYDKYSNDYKLDISKFDKVIIEDSEGKTYGLRELREWDILSAEISPDNELLHIYLSDAYAKGTCSYLDRDDNTVEIEDKEFDFTGDFRGDTNEIKSGKTVTAYLDIFGKVAALRPGSATEGKRSEGAEIVILTRFDKNDESGEDVYFMKTYASDNRITYRELGEKVIFNGTQKKSKELMTIMADEINNAIMISVGEDGKVASITTAAGPGEDENRGFYRMNRQGTKLGYGEEASHFGGKFRKGNVVYTVPEDASKAGNVEYYGYNTANFVNSGSYLVDGYSTQSDAFTASVIVYKSEAVKAGNYDANTGFVIGSVENRLDENDNVYKYMEGMDYYCKSDWGTQRGYEIDPDVMIVDKTGTERTDITIDDLKPGDCIRYGKNNGKINTVQLVYDYSEEILDSGHTNSAYAYNGYAYKILDEGSGLTIATGKRPEAIDLKNAADESYLQSFWIRQPMVTVVDMTGKKTVVRKGTMDDILTYSQTKTADGYSKLVLFSNWGSTIYGIVVYAEK